jgi:hypothetical protein
MRNSCPAGSCSCCPTCFAPQHGSPIPRHGTIVPAVLCNLLVVRLRRDNTGALKQGRTLSAVGTVVPGLRLLLITSHSHRKTRPCLSLPSIISNPSLFQCLTNNLGISRRVCATRWPEDIGNEDWFYGVNGSYLEQLVEYWIDSFDWRKAEGQISGYANYRLIIDDVPVHCLYKAGNGKSPIPIILSHGWPWTFWDWSKVIDPLADPGRFGGRRARG